jgi:hypothetical protein
MVMNSGAVQHYLKRPNNRYSRIPTYQNKQQIYPISQKRQIIKQIPNANQKRQQIYQTPKKKDNTYI